MVKFHVIIPAAGTGSRMGSALPKQYTTILDRPLILWALNVFLDSPRIHHVHVVISADDAIGPTLLPKHSKLQIHLCGGDTRSATVLNGLNAINAQSDDWVLVHDAARPGLTDELLNRLLGELEHEEVGGLLAIPLADTLKRADADSFVEKTEPRDNLWLAQTPQMFRYELLKKALIHSAGAPTDEAQAIESTGLKPKLVQGAMRNFKVTYPQDLLLAEAILNMHLKD